MDRTTLDAVDRLTGMGLGADGTPAAMLLAQSDTADAARALEAHGGALPRRRRRGRRARRRRGRGRGPAGGAPPGTAGARAARRLDPRRRLRAPRPGRRAAGGDRAGRGGAVADHRRLRARRRRQHAPDDRPRREPTRPRWPPRPARSTRSPHSPSTSAAPSPASTAWAGSSATGWPASSTPARWRCRGRSRPRWTRCGILNPGRAAGLRRCGRLIPRGPLRERRVGGLPSPASLLPGRPADSALPQRRRPPAQRSRAVPGVFVVVELRGLEPLTLCMPCRCATSCATAPSVCLSVCR